jgi:hypothetical protein
MHLLIPFAGSVSEGAGEALGTLKLPKLAALLQRLQPVSGDAGDEWSLSPPHERALAGELGFEGADGALPWAAHCAARDGIEPGELAWGLLSPTHWQVGSDRVTLADPDALELDEAASRELLFTVAPLFEGDGLLLQWGAPTRWYVAHELLADMPTASLDRVIGRNVDRWLPSAFSARKIRRLQSEVQMLLHTHPLNVAREECGLPPVNSFWLSGCGTQQAARATDDLRVLDALRQPALAEDWPGWCAAWQALDAGPIAEALDAASKVTLTLCGERSAQRFEPRVQGLWSRLMSRFGEVDVSKTLSAL